MFLILNLVRMRSASAASARVRWPSSVSWASSVPLTPPERLSAGGVAGVQHRAVGQHHPHAVQGPVAVLSRAATHAAGVVGGNPADLAGVDRGRIGTDLALVRGEIAVGVTADDARLQTDGRRALADAPVPPAIAQLQQHRVGDRLPGQAGAGGAERHRRFMPVRQFQNAPHLLFAVYSHHQLGNQAVQAGVSPIRQRAQRIVDQPRRWNELLQVVVKPVLGVR